MRLALAGCVFAVSFAQADSIIIAPAGEENPRNSEADIVDLPTGEFLLAWVNWFYASDDPH
jgi:hypothetical protein